MGRNEIKKAFEKVVGMQPREADYRVLEMMTTNYPEVNQTEVVAEYLWDHWLGEPEKPTVEEVHAMVKEAIV